MLKIKINTLLVNCSVCNKMHPNVAFEGFIKKETRQKMPGENDKRNDFYFRPNLTE